MIPPHLSRVPMAGVSQLPEGPHGHIPGVCAQIPGCPHSCVVPTRGEGCVRSGETVPTHTVPPQSLSPQRSHPGVSPESVQPQRPSLLSVPSMTAPHPKIWGWAWGDPPDLGLHPQGPVQPHHLPVDHGVLGQGLHEVGVLSRVPQPRRERHLLSQKLPDLLGQTSQERGGEQPWGIPKPRCESGHSPSSPSHPGAPLALPGAMVTTRMPSGARSRAMGRVMPTMPPLEAE